MVFQKIEVLTNFDLKYKIKIDNKIMVIKLSEKVEREVSDTVKDFGYKTEREFIEDALKRRILELKKAEFLSKTKEIKEKMEEKSLGEKEILEDFDKFTHQ